MKSLKEVFYDKNGCRLFPGKLYIIELPERDDYNYYLFEFDSISDGMIYNRNKWLNESGINEVMSGKNPFHDLNCGEMYSIKRYRDSVNWDTITYNDIR